MSEQNRISLPSLVNSYSHIEFGSKNITLEKSNGFGKVRIPRESINTVETSPSTVISTYFDGLLGIIGGISVLLSMIFTTNGASSLPIILTNTVYIVALLSILFLLIAFVVSRIFGEVVITTNNRKFVVKLRKRDCEKILEAI
jgi:uncharacterized protein with PQ loop repeat